MCGFAGFVSTKPFAGAEVVLEQMGRAIEHRGPDAAGVWFDHSLSLGLSHRRLSIIDLSEFGAQPMASESGRFVIAFNGEI